MPSSTWSKRLRERSTMSFVPLIGHFECRDACMARSAGPAGAASPMMSRPSRGIPQERRADAHRAGPARFVGCRANQPDARQMPQGGIDKGESAVEAARRELHEEVGTTKALLLRESPRWISLRGTGRVAAAILEGPLAWPGAEVVCTGVHRHATRTSTSHAHDRTSIGGAGPAPSELARADRALRSAPVYDARVEGILRPSLPDREGFARAPARGTRSHISRPSAPGRTIRA